MTEDQRDLLLKARESIQAARLLHGQNFHGFAVSRAYYAMFYVVQAFLEGDGLAFSKHSAVVSAFGQHFARTGRIPVAFHRYILEAMALRHEGDYVPRPKIEASHSTEQIARAEMFLALAERLMGPLPLDNTEDD